MILSFASINTRDLYKMHGTQPRYEQVEQLIGSLDADVVAVQEIVASGPDKAVHAAQGLRRLAAATGRECDIAGSTAVAVGGGQHHVGLMWRDGIEPVPGSLASFGRERAGMWHGLVTLVLDIGGPKIRVGSVQLSPFDQNWGVSDAHQILRAMQSGDVPGLLGGDFNGTGSNMDYDPDPYAGLPWRPDFVYQLDDHGVVDRRVARRLEIAGRMRDCAIAAGAPWHATIGHPPHVRHPARRIDRWYATYHLPPEALIAFQVIDTPVARECSDHLPIIVKVDTRTLTVQPR